MPDEEFDVLGEDELALLTRRFERLHENRVNMRRNTRTCFQCVKPGHFVADCPEKVENKDGNKHKSRMDGKYRSRRDHKSKHDEDMTLMHTTTIGAWNGVEEVQQGFPSQERGPRLIRFESLRWRPKAIQVRVQFGVQEQCAIKWTHRLHTESVLDVLYMVGSRIS
jgi:hypothetical protein